MLHRTIALLCLAVVFACTAALQAATTEAVERLTFTAAKAPEDALNKDGRLQLVIRRWSTDDERMLMTKAAAEPAKLLEPFRNVGGIGYLEWPGGLEYTVRYAHRTERPDGGSDILLVAERPLWVWWDPNAKWSNERPYSVIHVRVNKDGTGEGRVSSNIKGDKVTGIALADQTGAPLLTDVRRESASS